MLIYSCFENKESDLVCERRGGTQGEKVERYMSGYVSSFASKEYLGMK